MAKVPPARGDEIDSRELGFTLVAESISNVDPEVNLDWSDTFGAVEKRIDDAIAALVIWNATSAVAAINGVSN